MQLRCIPASRCQSPAYPTRLAVDADPQLLLRHVPPGWRARPEIAGTLGLLLAAGTTGCGNGSAPSSMPANSSAAALRTLVAPIFEHGYGAKARMQFTSMPVVPTPLGEDEAIMVISAELARLGIEAPARGAILDGVIIKGHKVCWEYDWISGWEHERCQPISGPLVTDLADPRRRIYIEYVSEDDFYALGGVFADDMDFIRAAENLSAQVHCQAQGVAFGVFYDPMVFWGMQRGWEPATSEPELPRLSDPDSLSEWRHIQGARNRLEDAHAQSRHLLRLQVQDFVDWLKAQGVI
jgi:hypothetical protein